MIGRVAFSCRSIECTHFNLENLNLAQSILLHHRATRGNLLNESILNFLSKKEWIWRLTEVERAANRTGKDNGWGHLGDLVARIRQLLSSPRQILQISENTAGAETQEMRKARVSRIYSFNNSLLPNLVLLILKKFTGLKADELEEICNLALTRYGKVEMVTEEVERVRAMLREREIEAK